jgi:hypothetical protein
MTNELHCPVCPSGPELRALDAHVLKSPLRRCDLCLGLLAHQSTVAAATKHYHSSHYVMVEGHGRHRCRSCDQLFDKARERCRVCRQEQAIGCVRCLRPMELMEVAGVTIDVCRPCRMVWFDRGELGLLTRRHSATLQGRLNGWQSSGVGSEIGNAMVCDVDPLPAAVEGAQAVGDVAIQAVGELAGSHVVELAAEAGEGAVELTAGAIEVVFSIVGDIF